MNKIIKSKTRVRDHGEVYTPDFIVDAMLDLVPHETERIESRFLEPACGNGNFLVKILERKLQQVQNKYKKSQLDFEFWTTIAISSIYWIDLLEDNIQQARDRLFEIIEHHYSTFFKKTQKKEFFFVIRYILEKNLLQGDALTLENKYNTPISFPEWSITQNKKIKRKDYFFNHLVEVQQYGNTLRGDNENIYYKANPIKEFNICYFLDIYQQANDEQQLTQPWCTRCSSKLEQWWGVHPPKVSEWNTRSSTKWTMVWLFD